MARKVAYVTGMDAVLRNIQRELLAVQGRTYIGMLLAMKHLEREMDTVSPTVPEGNEETRRHYKSEYMRDSWFIDGYPHPTNPIVRAGYTASYAPIVHERWDVVNWTKPGSGPKWLQIHFARNIQEMKLIVAQNAMIKPIRQVPIPGYTEPAGGFTNISQRTNERSVEF